MCICTVYCYFLVGCCRNGEGGGKHLLCDCSVMQSDHQTFPYSIYHILYISVLFVSINQGVRPDLWHFCFVHICTKIWYAKKTFLLALCLQTSVPPLMSLFSTLLSTHTLGSIFQKIWGSSLFNFCTSQIFPSTTQFINAHIRHNAKLSRPHLVFLEIQG